MPWLLVHGSEDTVVPVRDSEMARERAPDPERVSLVVLPGALVAAVLAAAERSLQMETAAQGAAGLLGIAFAIVAWREGAQGVSEASSVT